MEILMNHSKESIMDETSHRNLDGVFGGISQGWEDRTLLGSLVIDSYGSYKGYIYSNLDGGVGGKVNIMVIWVI